jgi:HK97 family phage major capsid protein
MRGLDKWFRRIPLTAAEARGIEITDSTKGGYLRPPKQWVGQLLKNVDDLLWMRRLATVYQIGEAESLGSVSLDTDYANADWTQEVPSSLTEDSAARFGNRELSPHQLTKLVKVSKKALRSSSLDAAGFVRSRMAYQFALTQEKGFLTGSGAQQPLGVFTASAQGISTSRDVSTGNTTTAMTYSGLKAAKYTLKAQYRNSSSIAWLFHRDAIAQLAKIVDGEGRFQWQDSVVASEPDRLLGYPVYESEWAPNTFTTALYVGLLGDFSYYWIADAGVMNVQQLVELYAGSLQDGFIGTMWCDGQPVLEEAFVRVKLA